MHTVQHRKEGTMSFKNMTIMLIILAVAFFSIASYAEVETVKTYNKAHDLYKKGKYEEAIKQYQAFMNKYPDSQLKVAALFYTAQCYQKENHNSEATKCYQEVINKHKKGYWVDSAKEEIKELKEKK